MSDGRSLGRRLLDGWLMIAAQFGEVQTLVILGLCYGLVIGPMATGIAVARRDLLAKRDFGAAGTAWRDPDTAGAELERAKRPF